MYIMQKRYLFCDSGDVKLCVVGVDSIYPDCPLCQIESQAGGHHRWNQTVILTWFSVTTR